MASSPISNDCGSTTNSHTRRSILTTTLPSLFGDNSVNGSSIAAGKELDGLIAMNDNALSQQIEFILQDAPMEQDDDADDDNDDDDGDGDDENERAVMESASSTDLGDVNLKLDSNPPTTTVVQSASDYSNSSGPTPLTADPTPHQQDHHLLNGRRIIIQTTEAAGMLPAMASNEIEDPELNDENLQDIEEEAQAAEAEEEEEQQMQHAHVKIEQNDESDEMEYINASTIAHAHAQLAGGQPQQLVLPAGSIVSTSALAQFQRRPVYISNAVGGMAGATFVRMPAVISRSPMAVLNVVQQGNGGPTTQLILQAAPMGNASTPVVVSSAGTTSVSAPISVTQAAAPPPPPLQTAQMVTASSTTTVPAIVAAASTSSALNPALPTTSSTQTTTPSSSSSAAAATTTTTTYQCVECVEKFDSKELFDIHRSGHANNMKCAICNMVLKSLKNYEKHCLRCKPYECQICGRVVRFRPNFIKHMRVHTGQQSERHKYKCDVCHKEFMSFEYFKVHKKIHNENVNLTCEICGKVFSALASLRGHSKLHSGVKLHKCDVCGKGFGQRYNLKIHARTHTGDFPFECKICKKKLHTQSSLQTHMQVHQRDQNAQVTTTTNPTTTSTAKYEQATSSGVMGSTNISTATIVKLEPHMNRDGPSTSGLQHTNTIQQQQMLHIENNDDDMDENENENENSMLSDSDNPIVSTTVNRMSQDDSCNSLSSNGSQDLRSQHIMLSHTPTRTIVFKNYMQDDQNAAGGSSNAGMLGQQQNVIHAAGSKNGTTLQQQMLRKTPIIHSTGGATTLSSALASVVQAGTSPSPSPSSSSTSCSSSVVVSKTGAPLSLASAAIGTSTIRSTRNPHHLGSSSSTSTLSNQQQQHQQNNHHRSLQRNNNNNNNNNNNHHRNHHRHHHSNNMDDDDDEEDDRNHHHHHDHHRLQLHHHSVNGRHFDDDDDDEKSSPSLATAAIIKIEPNLYSSGSGDNSNEMLIKEEVMFEDSAAPNSPHSPPSSKYRMSNFDSDLVDHHVDLNHSLPPYGNLFEPHSIPDSIPVQLYPDDDDDFRLDHSSLGGLHNTSSSTTDGDFIKKEWVYGAGSSYTMNGKFDDDSDALCDAANFIYN